MRELGWRRPIKARGLTPGGFPGPGARLRSGQARVGLMLNGRNWTEQYDGMAART